MLVYLVICDPKQLVFLEHLLLSRYSSQILVRSISWTDLHQILFYHD